MAVLELDTIEGNVAEMSDSQAMTIAADLLNQQGYWERGDEAPARDVISAFAGNDNNAVVGEDDSFVYWISYTATPEGAYMVLNASHKQDVNASWSTEDF